MRSVMAHQFSQVPSVGLQRSKFNRNHGLKTTLDSGYLVPVYWDEAYPGDSHTLRMNAFGRMATPIHPIMDNMYLDSFFFAVPIRLIWDNWEKFNGAQDNPGDSTDYLVPQMVAPATTGYEELSLADYFGLPTKVPDYKHSALYHRAYNLVFNEWFRDENLQDSVTVNKGDGPDPDTDYTLLRRGKRHDYFTSCLPWPQKDGGNPVLLPLGQAAPVTYPGNHLGQAGVMGPNLTGGSGVLYTEALSSPVAVDQGADGSGNKLLFADLSEATSATINDLREAFQIQRMYEKDARGGTRYVELIKSHFQVVSPDFRLQRPEFLGGGSTPVNVHPVTQTSETATQPQGSMAAFGTISLAGHGFSKSFTEHCILIGLVSIRADLTYQQGLERAFSRQTRFDWYWPSLANLGEQAVLNKEIFTKGSSGDDDVFGYQERWAELRYKQSRITGLFRSNATQSLDPWHLSQDFADLPALGDLFIQDNPPLDRALAVTTQPQFIFDAYFNLTSARPMPINSVPGLIDHF